MGISSVTTMGNTPGGQTMGTQTAQAVDNVSKGIENKISGVQRQMKNLSSREELSAEEKMQKRQELQKEMSRLNTQLRQHQADVNKEQRKEALRKESEEKETAGKETGNKEPVMKGAAEQERKGKETSDGQTLKDEKQGAAAKGRAGQDVGSVDDHQTLLNEQAIYAAGSSAEQMKNQGTVIARIEGGIAVLKSEISQDENRGVNVEKKKEDLAQREKRAQKAADFRKSVLEKAKQDRKPAQSQKGNKNSDGRFFIKGANFSKENQQAMQPVNISLK